MVLTDFVTFKDVFDRWKRSFPIVLDFDATYISEYNKIGEYCFYEDDIYEVIAKGFDGTTTPDTDTTHFSVTEEDIDDYVSQMDLEEYLLLGNEKFIDTNKFLFAYDGSGNIIEDDEYKLCKVAALYLMAHIIYEETYMRTQGIGAVTRYTKKNRNQSHVSETADIPHVIRNSPVLSSYGESQYGVNYIKTIYSRIRGINGFIVRVRQGAGVLG